MRVGEAWAMFVAVTLASSGAARAEATPAAPAKPPAIERETPPRTPLPPPPPSVPLPWERHLEVGADALFIARPTSGAVHLGAIPGYGAHVNWELLRHLRFTFYL